jgi:hypothetical protein
MSVPDDVYSGNASCRLIMSVPDDVYSGNASCALISISTTFRFKYQLSVKVNS